MANSLLPDDGWNQLPAEVQKQIFINTTTSRLLGNLADIRSHRLPLVPSVMTPCAIIAVYLFLTTRVGRFVTQPLPPMDFLRWPIVVYNFVLVIFNAYIVAILYYYQHKLKYKWTCETVDYKTDDYSMQILWGLYMYYLSKIVELADTLFLVLRKKWRQLSFLHRYHHASMIFITWLIVYGYGGGNCAQAAMVNAAVHVLMYTYYGLAALSSMKKDWHLRRTLYAMKKYMTLVQLAQFALGLVLAVIGIREDCPWNRIIVVSFVLYVTSMVVLFSNFYYRAYVKERERRESAAMLYAAAMNARQQKSVIDAAVAKKVDGKDKTKATQTVSNGTAKTWANVASANGHQTQQHANGKKVN